MQADFRRHGCDLAEFIVNSITWSESAETGREPPGSAAFSERTPVLCLEGAMTSWSAVGSELALGPTLRPPSLRTAAGLDPSPPPRRPADSG